MCAKKAASSTASSKITTKLSKPVTVESGKSPANGKPGKAPAMHPLAASERTLSEIHIGEVAGEIWGLLSKGEGQTLAVIKKAIPAPPDVITAAIGWLAREDKLEFIASGRTMKITLKL
jgi:Winged helix-turn-helix domain (DUF2582)